MEIASYVQGKTSKMYKEIEKIDEYKSRHDYDASIDSYCTLIRLCVEMTNSIKKKACEDCCQKDIDDELGRIIDASYEKDGDITKITINSLLPVRIKGYHVYERETLEKIYLAPLIKLMHENRAVMYREKVVICFIHYFGKGSRLIDHDNFEIKPFVDAIASVLLVDDNPAFLSYYMNHRMSETDKTEIYLVPEREFSSFLLKIEGDANV